MAFLNNGVALVSATPSGGWGEYASSPAGTINYISGTNTYYHNTTQHGGGSGVGGYDIPLGVRKVTLHVDNLNLNTSNMADWEIGLMISTGSQTQTSGYYGRWKKGYEGTGQIKSHSSHQNAYGNKYGSASGIRIPWGQVGYCTNFTLECTRNVSNGTSTGSGLHTGPISRTSNSRWTCIFWGDTGTAGNSYDAARVFSFQGRFIQTALSGGNIRGFQIKTPNGTGTTFAFDSLSCNWDF